MKKLILITSIVLQFNQTCFSQATMTIDPSFITGTAFDQRVNKVILQPDGKILAAGEFTTYNGANSYNIIRLNPDGSIDPNFTIGTGFLDSSSLSSVSSIALQTDGKIIAVGAFQIFDGHTCNYIVRLNPDGTFDSSFNPGSGCDRVIDCVALRDDGKIIIAGAFSNYNSIPRDEIAQLNSDGSLDTSFDPGFVGAGNFGGGFHCLLIQHDQKILLGGAIGAWGVIPTYNLVRIDTTGSRDFSFLTNAGFDKPVNVLIQQPDGKIVVGGEFQNFTSIARASIARLYTNGTIDNTFDPGNGFEYTPWGTGYSSINAMISMPDSSLILSGYFDKYNGYSINSFARISNNATFDTTFNTGFGIGISGLNPGYASSLALQTDGKIIAGGVFNDFNLTSCNYITRFTGAGISTGVRENFSNASFSVYPNPTHEKINVTIQQDIVNPILFTITNIAGEIIQQQFLKKLQTEIDLSELPSGIYFGVLEINDLKWVQKIIRY